LTLKNRTDSLTCILRWGEAEPGVTEIAAASKLDAWITHGGLAQLGERLHGMQEVRGSSPLSSTLTEVLGAYKVRHCSAVSHALLSRKWFGALLPCDIACARCCS
jgi:hypothetical protein